MMRFGSAALILVVVAACSQEPGPHKGDSEMKTDVRKMTEEDWKKKLTPEQYYVCRQKGTERAGSGKYNDFWEEGVYRCVCCGQELFSSKHKYESGCGWPAFWEAISKDSVKLVPDRGALEAVCSKCDAHLGHLFDDGPPPTGKRY